MYKRSLFKISLFFCVLLFAQSLSANTDQLSFVPADTLFYMGGLEPYPFDINNHPSMRRFRTAMAGANQNPYSGETPASAILKAYTELTMTQEDPIKRMGIDPTVYTFYSVGPLPVQRWTIADPKKFESFVKALEKQAKIKPKMKKIASLNYRFYALDSTDTSKGLALQFNKKRAVITLDTGKSSEKFLKVAFGVKKPVKSLSAKVLKDIAKTYGFKPYGIGYINNQAIVKAFFDEGDSALVTLLSQMSGEFEEIQNSLDEMRQSKCKDDILRIAGNWPRGVFGSKHLSNKKDALTMEMQAVFESRDKAFIDNLKQLLGKLPVQLHGINTPAMFSMGLGINMDKLVPVYQQFATGIQKQKYQCDSLKSMQASINPQQAAGLVMFTGMAAGAKGLSVALFDLKMNTDKKTKKQNVEQIDAAVTVASDNPEAVAARIVPMLPGMQGRAVPKNGKSIDMPVPLGQGMPPVTAKLAIKGKYLAAYTGSQGTQSAASLAKNQNRSRLFNVTMDFGRYLELVDHFGDAIIQSDADLKNLQAMKAMNMKMDFGFGVIDAGITMDVGMKLH